MNLRPLPTAAAALALAAALAGCQDEREPAPPTTSPSRAAEATEMPPASIIRPEVAAEPAEPAPPPPLETTIAFPDGGNALDDAAEQTLRGVLESDQLAEGWPIVLRGHSDSAGGDEANMRVSRRRAEAVAEWLVEQGVDEKRISVIAFGEQNPVAPNARPDGAPDKAGRARNRRVEISIAPAEDAPDAEETEDEASRAEPDAA